MSQVEQALRAEGNYDVTREGVGLKVMGDSRDKFEKLKEVGSEESIEEGRELNGRVYDYVREHAVGGVSEERVGEINQGIAEAMSRLDELLVGVTQVQGVVPEAVPDEVPEVKEEVVTEKIANVEVKVPLRRGSGFKLEEPEVPKAANENQPRIIMVEGNQTFYDALDEVGKDMPELAHLTDEERGMLNNHVVTTMGPEVIGTAADDESKKKAMVFGLEQQNNETLKQAA